MKVELKKQQKAPTHRLILYPNEGPSVGYTMTRQELYELYCELRDIFQEETLGTVVEPAVPLGLSVDE